MTKNQLLKLLATTAVLVLLTGCKREPSETDQQRAVRLFEQTVADYSAKTHETDPHYDVKTTDSLVVPFQAIYYATFTAGNGTRIERRKIFNYRDGGWQPAGVDHLQNGNWVPGAWLGGSDEDLSLERYYWEEAAKNHKE